ncbi:hypothetical protein D3C85_1297200 [compost metagenome]
MPSSSTNTVSSTPRPAGICASAPATLPISSTLSTAGRFTSFGSSRLMMAASVIQLVMDSALCSRAKRRLGRLNTCPRILMRRRVALAQASQ